MKNIAVLNPLLFHKKIVCQGFKGRGQFIGKFRDWGVETIPLWGKEINIERGTQSISILHDATIAQKFRYCAVKLWLLPLIHNYPHLSTPPTPTHPPPQNQRSLSFPLFSAAPAALVGRCWVVIKKLKTIQFQSSQNHQPRCLSPKTSAFLSFPFPCPWQLWLDEVEWYWSASAQHPPASGRLPPCTCGASALAKIKLVFQEVFVFLLWTNRFELGWDEELLKLKPRRKKMTWGFVTCGPNEALVISGSDLTTSIFLWQAVRWQLRYLLTVVST